MVNDQAMIKQVIKYQAGKKEEYYVVSGNLHNARSMGRQPD
jgi:hypothetical protein